MKALDENTELQRQHSFLVKRVIRAKVELEELGKKKAEINTHCEKEQKKINDTLKGIGRKEADLKSQEDTLCINGGVLQREIGKCNKGKATLKEKESSLEVKGRDLESRETELKKSTSELTALKDEVKTSEKSSKKASEVLGVQSKINQKFTNEAIKELEELDKKKKESAIQENKVQEETQVLNNKIKEQIEREEKLLKVVDILSEQEKQIEIKQKNIRLAEKELETNQRLFKEKQLTAGIK